MDNDSSGVPTSGAEPIPGYLRDLWPWSVLDRRDRGESVSRAELEEAQEHVRWQEEWRQSHEQQHKKEEAQEADLLERLRPPEMLVTEVLRLARADQRLIGDMQGAMAKLIRPHYTTPVDRQRYQTVEEETVALQELLCGVEKALAGGACLRGRSASALRAGYRDEACRFVRSFERKPRLRRSVVLSPEAAILCWDPWLHLQLLAESARARLRELAPKRGRRPSADWKKQLALEAAALVYKARIESGNNAPLPSDRDGSTQAIQLLLAKALEHLETGLSTATIASYVSKAATLLRKLSRSDWIDDNGPFSDEERDTIAHAVLPRCCSPPPLDRDELEEVVTMQEALSARWRRWWDLTDAFEKRTGLRRRLPRPSN